MKWNSEGGGGFRVRSNVVLQRDVARGSASLPAIAASPSGMPHRRRGTPILQYLLLPQHSSVRQRLKTAVVIKEDCSGLKEMREGKRANSPPGSYGSEKERRPRSASSLPGDGEHRSLPAPFASIWSWALWCATPLLWAVRCLQGWLAVS